MNSLSEHSLSLDAARSELLAGRPAAALQLLARLDRSGVNAAYLNVKGVAHHQLGDMTQAISTLRQAVEKESLAEYHNNLGNALRDSGQVGAAVQQYRVALERDTGSAEVWCNLGATLTELGELNEALAAFESALQIDPLLADAHGAIGVLHSHLGGTADAIHYLQRALELEPERAAFHDALGLALQRNNDWERACLVHQAALRLAPRSPEILNNLGHALCRAGRSREAIPYLELATRLAPTFVEAHNNLGIARQDCGQVVAAEESFDRAIELRPQYAVAHFNRSELRRFVDPTDERLQGLQHLVNSLSVLSCEDRALTYFALGKAWDDLRKPALAFESWQHANRLVRQSVSYDESAMLRRLARIRITAETVERLSTSSVGDVDVESQGEGCVFIIGLPRSGSTLVEQIIAVHPDACTRGESSLMERLLLGANTGNSNDRHFTAWSVQQIASIRQSYLQAGPRRRVVVDKFLGNALHVAEILRVFPRARFISLVRHPLDIALSCYSKRFTSGHEYSYELAELARYIVAFGDLLKHWSDMLPKENLLVVRYEDLVDDFPTQTRRILNFSGLSWNSRCLEFHKYADIVTTASAAQVRQPLNKLSLQRWRCYEAQLKPVIRILSSWQGP